MNAHTHTHRVTHVRTHNTCARAHTTNTHTHTVTYQGHGTEEKFFKQRKVFKQDLKELTEVVQGQHFASKATSATMGRDWQTQEEETKTSHAWPSTKRTHFGQSACSSCRHMLSRSMNFCGNDPKSTSNPCCTFRLHHNKASTSFNVSSTIQSLSEELT